MWTYYCLDRVLHNLRALGKFVDNTRDDLTPLRENVLFLTGERDHVTWLCGVLSHFEYATKLLSRATEPTLSQVPHVIWHLYERTTAPELYGVKANVSRALHAILQRRFGDVNAAFDVEDEVYDARLGGLPRYAALAASLDPRIMIKGRKHDTPTALRHYLRLKASTEAGFVHQELITAGIVKPARFSHALSIDFDSDSDSDSDDDGGMSVAGDVPVRTPTEWEGMLKDLARHVRDYYQQQGKDHAERWRSTHADDSGEVYDELSLADCFQNPLKFWKERREAVCVRDFYRMAVTCLCLPATESASERLFKRVKRLAADDRTLLAIETLEKQVVIGANLEHVGVRYVRGMTAYMANA